MPIRRGSVSFSRFRVQGDTPKDVRRWLTHALRARAFEPIDPKSDEDKKAGFVELEADRATDFSPGAVFFGLHALFAWRVEKLRIPGARVREQLLEWAAKFEQQNGRAPGRREKAEGKEAVRRALRGKTEPAAKVFDVSYELSSQDLFVWAASRGVVEEVQEALEGSLGVKLVPRVPAAFLKAAELDRLEPTPELFGEEVSHAGP